MLKNIDTHQIKALLFDFGGTLDHDGLHWGLRIYYQFKEQNIQLEKKQVLKASHDAMKMLYTDLASKDLSYHDTVDIYIYWTLKNMKLTVEHYKKSLVTPFIEHSKKTIQKNAELLKLLSHKYQLGIISNNFGNCRGWCNDFKISSFFKIIIDSTEARLEKPDEEIFKYACNELDINLNEAAYIGDKFSIDIEVPKKLKMLPVWINSDPEEKNRKDIIRIQKFEELKELFNITDEPKLLS